jgi:hypothetical protein
MSLLLPSSKSSMWYEMVRGPADSHESSHRTKVGWTRLAESQFISHPPCILVPRQSTANSGIMSVVSTDSINFWPLS